MNQPKNFLLIVAFSFIAQGCASLGNEGENEGLSVTDSSAPVPEASITATTLGGNIAIDGEENKDDKSSIEWMACENTGPEPNGKVFVLMHDENASFQRGSFCSDWHAQAFLGAGYHVVAVNRPGFGSSTGVRDFSGAPSQSAIQQVLAQLASSHPTLSSFYGIWGHGSGAIAAAFVARRMNDQNWQWLVVGNGVYDTEQALEEVADQELRRHIEMFVSREGEDGHEDRSISWMSDDLPKNIFMYHGENNQEVSLESVSSFKDTLITAQYQVRLEPVAGAGHQLTEAQHRQVLDAVISSIQ